jgi:23S rRNA pseudouridine2605 synthase
MASVRLQKLLAHAGVSSRRAAEELITAGRVRVDGRVVTELGTKVDQRGARVEVDGVRVVRQSAVYIMLHKPRGVVSTMSDPEGRQTVKDLLTDVSAARVYPVGRLDFNTSGALVVTNDGDFSVALMHPRKAVPKTYVIKVNGKMEDRDVDLWRRGVELEDGKTLPAKVKLLRYEGDKTWLELTITEGRNQQIRRMGDVTGFRVMRLARLSFAGIGTEGLTPGQWRYLTADELSTMKKTFGVPKRVVTPPKQDPAPKRAPHRAAAQGTHAGGGATGGRGPAAGRGPAEGRDAPRGRGPAEGRGPPRGRGPAEGRGPARGHGSADRARGPDRRGPPGGAAEAGANDRGGPPERRGPARASGRPAGGAEGPRQRAQGRPAQDGFASNPRYGGGSPARRPLDVREDWGGGVRRGASFRDADRGASGSDGGGEGKGDGGGESDSPPRGELGGRGGRTRTTGSGGGVGAGPGGYRVKGRHG